MDRGEEGVGATMGVMQSNLGSSGQFGLSVVGKAGRSYVIEVSDDLVTWDTLRTITVTGDSVSVMDDVAGMNRRFYRTREQ